MFSKIKFILQISTKQAQLKLQPSKFMIKLQQNDPDKQIIDLPFMSICKTQRIQFF